MKLKFLAFVGSLLPLTSCSTVTLPVNRKVPVKQVCGPLAPRKCAPSMGTAFPLTQQQKTIEVDGRGNPKLDSYLGTVVQRNNSRGEPGAICGGGATSPFSERDFIKGGTYNNKVELVYTLEQNIDVGVKADLTAAMVASGVPAQVTNRVQADLETTFSQLKKQVINATAYFSEYQLKTTSLSELDAAENSGRFKGCLAELLSGNWRLYQAITGMYVTDGRLDSTTTTTIIANLVAKIKLADPRVDTARLSANLERVVTQRIKSATKPYFVVVGLSFYNSPRHEIINGKSD